MKNDQNPPSLEAIRLNRRRFLGYAGATVGASALLIAGCKKDDDDDNNNGTPIDPNAVNLGSGDIGVLNYAYALEQLEAAFYTQVVANFGASDLSAAERSLLNDIQKHEVAHRDLFKGALGSNAIKDLEVNFTSIDFTKRASVLGTAKAFEDLGVSAYNGAGKLLVSSDYLLLAGKIVSVEARHAAAIRHLLNPFSADFAGTDVIDGNGLDLARTPSQVLAIAKTYVKTPINASNLPTS
ncbi:MAG: ferritin-like domain-containing protein [Bacteroidota bacterium]